MKEGIEDRLNAHEIRKEAKKKKMAILHKEIITDAEGIQFLSQGKAQHSHVIRLTLEDRIEIAESDIKNLEKRVAALEITQNTEPLYYPWVYK